MMTAAAADTTAMEEGYSSLLSSAGRRLSPCPCR